MDEIVFRRATVADVPEIVVMLADDPLGRARESVPVRHCLADHRTSSARALYHMFQACPAHASSRYSVIGAVRLVPLRSRYSRRSVMDRVAVLRRSSAA